MAGAASYPEGYDPLVTDPEQRLLVKVVAAVNAGGGGSPGGGVAFHQGAFLDPNGNVTATVGDVYVSSTLLGGDGSTWWKLAGNGNNTGWGT